MQPRIDMIAYEFYLRKEGKDHLIGILPERRKNSERITRESIMNWGKMVIGHDAEVDLNALHFVQIEI